MSEAWAADVWDSGDRRRHLFVHRPTLVALRRDRTGRRAGRDWSGPVLRVSLAASAPLTLAPRCRAAAGLISCGAAAALVSCRAGAAPVSSGAAAERPSCRAGAAPVSCRAAAARVSCGGRSRAAIVPGRCRAGIVRGPCAPVSCRHAAGVLACAARLSCRRGAGALLGARSPWRARFPRNTDGGGVMRVLGPNEGACRSRRSVKAAAARVPQPMPSRGSECRCRPTVRGCTAGPVERVGARVGFIGRLQPT